MLLFSLTHLVALSLLLLHRTINMQAKRVLLLLPALLLNQVSIVSNANFWDGFHIENTEQQNDQQKIPYDESDGYGVDIVRIFNLSSLRTDASQN